ncbi:hypothetical protein SERLA73DRAFT_80184 [Serpula lacrymans var. lacrymans S7.3]|uniref:Uncharacterized protein n=2 Tax=Serpula lacrymans var. lacrymans TaxID=341189 RepID=F8QIZ6_SERL3|nr:uncharacterized protein SERLADRAFT_432289 [Serpula lacrymans var. lacrymans S7.9]EGN91723.1 hypothetical protein SERLA73DRAFT_80184 [Serpula lacrymans var. lacrymans S7.3]EGO30683.1 hypothetical protein SERLADRAFT_432289 [Serpula lacrymans var. lacrymans S7.9]
MSEYATLSLALNSVPNSLSTVSTMQKLHMSPAQQTNFSWLAFNWQVSISRMEGTLLWDLANLLQSPILTNNVWTECKQEHAEKGDRINNADDLQSQLRRHYKKGMKISDGIYICIPMDAIPNSLVDIHNSDETLMAFIRTSLPAKTQNSLTDNLLAVFGTVDLLTETNTRIDADSTFQALHLLWYNRHCTKGYEAPSDIPPSMLDRVGCVHTNHSQMIPSISKDVKDNQKMFQSLKIIFKELYSVSDSDCLSKAKGVRCVV